MTAFPVYDAHGNNVASLTRSGAGFSIGDRRTYDAWGVVRSQQSGGDPKLRYCASLGHKQDDETGLIYMRARYYEPGTGRFISEDTHMGGGNWFAYASNRPTDFGDKNGCDILGFAGGVLEGLAFFFGSLAIDMMRRAISPAQIMAACQLAQASLWCATISLGIETGGVGSGWKYLGDAAFMTLVQTTLNYLVKACDLLGMTAEASAGLKTEAGAAVAAVYAYSLLVMGYEVYAIIGE